MSSLRRRSGYSARGSIVPHSHAYVSRAYYAGRVAASREMFAKSRVCVVLALVLGAVQLAAQKPQPAHMPDSGRHLTRRVWPVSRQQRSPLLSPDIRVDPQKKFISGKNTIRFKMLEPGTRIQLDLHHSLQIDKILFGKTALNYERDSVQSSSISQTTLRAGHAYSIDFYYSGNPVETGRFGGFTFQRFGGTSMDQHSLRRDRRERLVAE